ncbi:hypothetical protein, partial [Ureaplasma ceti]|uniref:hypothetical protein n=1 Tax=Ureaplasma ceti TaxID=3119530 RepID=UPI003342AD59
DAQAQIASDKAKTAVQTSAAANQVIGQANSTENSVDKLAKSSNSAISTPAKQAQKDAQEAQTAAQKAIDDVKADKLADAQKELTKAQGLQKQAQASAQQAIDAQNAANKAANTANGEAIANAENKAQQTQTTANGISKAMGDIANSKTASEKTKADAQAAQKLADTAAQDAQTAKTAAQQGDLKTAQTDQKKADEALSQAQQAADKVTQDEAQSAAQAATQKVKLETEINKIIGKLSGEILGIQAVDSSSNDEAKLAMSTAQQGLSAAQSALKSLESGDVKSAIKQLQAAQQAEGTVENEEPTAINVANQNSLNKGIELGKVEAEAQQSISEADGIIHSVAKISNKDAQTAEQLAKQAQALATAANKAAESGDLKTATTDEQQAQSLLKQAQATANKAISAQAQQAATKANESSTIFGEAHEVIGQANTTTTDMTPLLSFTGGLDNKTNSRVEQLANKASNTAQQAQIAAQTVLNDLQNGNLTQAQKDLKTAQNLENAAQQDSQAAIAAAEQAVQAKGVAIGEALQKANDTINQTNVLNPTIQKALSSSNTNIQQMAQQAQQDSQTASSAAQQAIQAANAGDLQAAATDQTAADNALKSAQTEIQNIVKAQKAASAKLAAQKISLENSLKELIGEASVITAAHNSFLNNSSNSKAVGYANEANENANNVIQEATQALKDLASDSSEDVQKAQGLLSSATANNTTAQSYFNQAIGAENDALNADNETINKLESEVNNLTNTYNSLKDSTTETINSLNRRIQVLLNRIQTQNQEISGLENDNSTLQTQVNNQKAEIQQLENQNQNLENVINQYKQQIQEDNAVQQQVDSALQSENDIINAINSFSTFASQQLNNYSNSDWAAATSTGFNMFMPLLMQMNTSSPHFNNSGSPQETSQYYNPNNGYNYDVYPNGNQITNGIANQMQQENIPTNYANLGNALGNIMLKFDYENTVGISGKVFGWFGKKHVDTYNMAIPSSPASYFLSLFDLLANNTQIGYLGLTGSWLDYWINQWLNFYNFQGNNQQVTGTNAQLNETDLTFFNNYAHYTVVGTTNLGGQVTATENGSGTQFSYFNVQDVTLNLTFDKTITWTNNGETETYMIQPTTLTVSPFVKENMDQNPSNGFYLNQNLNSTYFQNDTEMNGLVFDINFNGYLNNDISSTKNSAGNYATPFNQSGSIWSMEAENTVNVINQYMNNDGTSAVNNWYINSDPNSTTNLYWQDSILSESLPWSYLLNNTNLLPAVYTNQESQ